MKDNFAGIILLHVHILLNSRAIKSREVFFVIKFAYRNGFHFVGKFDELIVQLSSIKDKNITLKEYIETYRRRLN